MKPYQSLTYLGRLRRLTKLARLALAAFGMENARMKLLRDAGNLLFRVVESPPIPTQGRKNLFEDGVYLMRLLQPAYQTPEAVVSELQWLAALRQEADLPVPQPIPTREGGWLAEVTDPSVPGSRNATLVRWVKGRMIKRTLKPGHFQAAGKLMARLHDHAAHWQFPEGFSKRHYNWEGFFVEVTGSNFPPNEAWKLLPQDLYEPCRIVAQQSKRVMERWGQERDVYGLIHADLGIDANCLFWGGEARAIDFDDSGFGYWIYDIAVFLEHFRDDSAYPLFRDAFQDGYSEIRTLPAEQWQQLELFMAVWHAYEALWSATGAHLFPSEQSEYMTRVEHAGNQVKRYVEECSRTR
jgi:Ser/Thr protein kinase RdoA (MazF antagonist)